MPQQYLYPTGIAYSFNTWINQSGHLYTADGIGVKDIDEGVPGNNLDFLQNLGAFNTNTYILDLYCGPLLVEPEYVQFRSSYQYSGLTAGIDRIRFDTTLYDANNIEIAGATNYSNITAVSGGITTVTYSGTSLNPIVNYNNTRLQIAVDAISPFLAEDIVVFSSGHVFSAIEVYVSGDSISTSGVPLICYGYPHKNVCIKPQAFEGLSNKWHGNFNYSGNFDLAYTRMEHDGSGLIIRSENSTVSGVYYVTAQGLSSGLLWHQKRMSQNYEPTYEHAAKFSSVDDSAIVFDSGILFNRTNFTVLQRYFPSGETFIANGSGYMTILNNSAQDASVHNCNWRVETSGFQLFKLTMIGSDFATYRTDVSIDGRRGFDLLVNYGAGSAGLYVQTHTGNISSGIVTIPNLWQSHEHRLSIGGILASGV